MFLTRVRSDGLIGVPPEVLPAGRAARLGDGVVGVADAIELAAAGLSPQRLLDLAASLGLTTAATALAGDPADPALTGLDPTGARALFGGRTGTVELEIGVDPPLFGRLREHAVRDPRLASALGREARMTLRVGWYLAADARGLSLSVLRVALGDVAFELVGKERPPGLSELLRDLGGRFARPRPFEAPVPLAERLVEASLSPDPVVREGWRRVCTALQAPPFSLPCPELVRGEAGASVAFGPELLPLRRLGRAAADALRWTSAAYVDRPDVLLVAELVPAPVADWLAGLPDQPEAPVEQVVLA